jgi:hypothetical protein
VVVESLRRECEKLAKRLDAWMEIDCAVEKDDIVEYYGDASMPTFFWLLAKKVRPRFIPFGSSCSAPIPVILAHPPIVASMRATGIKTVSREICGWTRLVGLQILLEKDIMEVSTSTSSRDLAI